MLEQGHSASGDPARADQIIVLYERGTASDNENDVRIVLWTAKSAIDAGAEADERPHQQRLPRVRQRQVAGTGIRGDTGMSGSDDTATKAPNRTSATSNAKVHRMQRTGPHPPWKETVGTASGTDQGFLPTAPISDHQYMARR
jgi:hypothetical protein